MDELYKTNLIGKINFTNDRKRGIIRDDIKNFAEAELGETRPTRQRDLLYFKDIFVSQGWNLNDDIFLQEELIKSWDTVTFKPVDWEHDRDRIIGVIYDSYITSKDGEKIPSDALAELKDDQEIDIATESVIYKWLFPEEAALVKASADIESDGFNQYAVSMECFFKRYDYGILEGDITKIVERNEETAFLDQYLRACGGKGIFSGKKIGRVLRDIVFGGKGIVKNPANIESIIMSAAKIIPQDSDEIIKEHNEIILHSVTAEVNLVKEEAKGMSDKIQEVASTIEEDITTKEEVKTEAKTEKPTIDYEANYHYVNYKLLAANIKIAELENLLNITSEKIIETVSNAVNSSIKEALAGFVIMKEEAAIENKPVEELKAEEIPPQEASAAVEDTKEQGVETERQESDDKEDSPAENDVKSEENIVSEKSEEKAEENKIEVVKEEKVMQETETKEIPVVKKEEAVEVEQKTIDEIEKKEIVEVKEEKLEDILDKVVVDKDQISLDVPVGTKAAETVREKYARIIPAVFDNI